jgi:leucine dehydrogenase
VINDGTIPQLKCDIIAGSANNVLDDEQKHGQVLLEQGIMYAPDYVINAGGLINVASELGGYQEEMAHAKADHIYDTILDILDYSEENNIPTHVASDIIAEKRIEDIGRIHSIYSSKSRLSGHIGEMYKAKQ